MCCFSRPVTHVSQTQIFARSVAGGRQALIYSLALNSAEPVAMILPIPVADPRTEDSVSFISLKDYPTLFAGLARCFPATQQPLSANDALGPATRGDSAPLKVLEVGNFVASFVPRVRDFDRLDAQFRLPAGVWEKLGAYANFGFAVFKFKPGEARIHPMAFVFPTATPGKLFFPTVHIHDGEVHARADFDHTLYCQINPQSMRGAGGWQESELPARRFVGAASTRNLVLGDSHVYRRILTGNLVNEDTFLTLG